MATEVENRVVAMEFDNKNFEKNMAQTMQTLDEFDEKLNFKGAEKGFQTIESAAKKCDLGPMEKAVSSLEMKFSALQIAGVTAISRIVNAAIDAGGRIVKSLTIDPVSSGWAQYETKVASVRTIMNATGDSIETVNAALDKLAIFTDETSYSFADMIDNIGKFTANNVPLDKSVSAMQGIANWAAVSGQNTQAAARAMYNLSQALSVGAVTAIDWKSIEMANMATKEFKEEVIKTAKAMGKLDAQGKNLKGNIVTIESFRETLSDKWFDSDVLVSVLDKYNVYSDAVVTIMNETGVAAKDAMAEIDEYLKVSGDETLLFGQKVFRAAQEAKTFTDAINATKDAVKTGWQTTFDIIFGDANKSVELWTNLANTMYDIFAAGAEARNEMLQEWSDLGGRAALLDTVSTAFENITAVIGAFKQALQDVFPPMTGKKLADITKGINLFVKQLKLSDDALKTVTNAVKTFLLPIKIVANILEITAIGAAVLTLKLFKLADSFLAANAEGGIFNNMMIKIFGEERYTRIGNAMTTILTNIGKALSNLVIWVKGLFKETPQAEALHKIWEAIGKVLTPIAGFLLDRIVDGFEILANLDFSNLINLGTDILNGMVSAFQSIIQYVPPVTGDIGAFLEKFSKATPAEFFTIIADGFKQLSLNWSKFKSNFTIGGIAKTINNQFNNMMAVIDGLGDAFVRLVERLDPAKILISAFGVTLVGTIWSVKRAIESGTKVMNSFSGVLDSIKKRIEPKGINPTVKALVALAGAMTIMALVPADRLKQATVSMISLMAALTAMNVILSLLNKSLEKAKIKTGAVKQLAITMTYISAAVLALAGAMAILSQVPLEGMLPRLLTLGAIMAALTAVCVIMSKNAKELTKGSGFMVAYAISINLMVVALQRLADSDLSGIEKNIGSLIVIVGLLGVIGIAASKVKFSSAAGMTGMIINMILIIGLLKAFSKTDMSKILTGLLAFIPVIAAIAAIGLALHTAGQNGAKMGGTFLALSASMVILAQGIKSLAALDAGEIARGGAVMGGIIIIFGLFTKLATMSKDQKVAKMGGTFIGMSAAIIALSGAIYLLGNMDVKVVAQGGIVVAAILAMFTVIMAVGKESKGAMGAILAMTAAIGTLIGGLGLLTLIDTKELLGASAALSLVLVAFGQAIKSLRSLNIIEAVGSLPGIVLIITGLTGGLYLLSKLDLKNVLGSALAMSSIMIAFGVVTKNLISISASDAVTAAGMLGVMLTELALIFTVIQNLDGNKMIAQSSALSLAVISFGGIVALLSTIKIKSGKDLVAPVIAIGALITELALVMGIIGKVMDDPDMARYMTNGATFLKGLADLLPILSGITLLVAACATIGGVLSMAGGMGLVGMFAAEGALMMLIGGVGAVMYALGSLIDSPEAQKVMKNGVTAFELIGAAIGGFIGNIIGGLVGGIASGALPVLGENLASFSTSIQPFLDMGTNYNKNINENVSNFVDAVTDITRAGQIWNSSGLDFELFGQDFEKFGPHLGTFIKGLSDVEFDTAKVDSASNAAEAIAKILEVLPQEGGIKAAIFGQTDFGGFVNGLGKLGPAIAKLATNVEGISANAFDNAIKALEVVAEFAKNDIPASGGFLQTLIGEQNLGTFGRQLDDFSIYFASFASRIADIPDVRDKCKIMAEAIGSMAAVDIPATGGFLQNFLGNKDIDIYGQKLMSFAPTFKAFSLAISNISEDIVSKSGLVAEAVSAMASIDVPQTGGFLEFITGKSDLGTFGTQLQTLGTALGSFNTNIEPLNLDKTNGAIRSISTIADMSGKLSEFDSAGVNRFIYGVKNLSTVGVDEFTTTWNASSTKIATAINDSIYTVSDNLSSNTGMNNAAEAIMTGFINGLSQNERKLSETGKNLGTTLESSIRKTQGKQKTAGSFVVEGLINGIDSEIPSVKKVATRLTDALTNTTEENLQIASPSKRFETIGKYVVEGLMRGMTKNEKNAGNSILKVANGIYNTITDFFEIHSPSVKMEEVGKYIVQGIGEGMKKDMTAEEIAKQKVTNIFTAFTDAMNLQAIDFKKNNTLYEIWQLENSLASTSLKISKERETKYSDLNEQVKEYNDLLAQQQALDKIENVDKNSKDYKELQQTILEKKQSIYQTTREIIEYEQSIPQLYRDQARALENVKSESRDLEYERWELLNKGATSEEKFNKKRQLSEQKIVDQQNEYNRLVDEANELLLLGYSTNSTEYLSAVNKVSQAYNNILTTIQSINDLETEHKNTKLEEENTLRDIRKEYYDELTSDYYQNLINEGGIGFSDDFDTRLKEVTEYLQKKHNLDADLNLLVDGKPVDEYLKDSDLHQLKTSVPEDEISKNMNADTMFKNILDSAGFNEDFLAEFPLFDDKLVYEKSVSSGQSAAKGFEDGITNSDVVTSGLSGENTPGWLQNIINGMKGTTEEGGEEAGANLGKGFLAGLADNAGKALDSVKQWGSDQIAAGKEGLGEHSPSVYMEEAGMFFIEGFINGLKKKSESAYSTVQSVCSKIVSIANQTLSTPSSSYVSPIQAAFDHINDTPSLQPVIRPVVDMSDVEKTLKNYSTSSLGGTIQVASKTSAAVSKQKSQNEAILSQGQGPRATPSKVEFNQTIIAPKTPSRLDLYRDGQALTSKIKTVLKQ